jgi:hypothetical protein
MMMKILLCVIVSSELSNRSGHTVHVYSQVYSGHDGNAPQFTVVTNVIPDRKTRPVQHASRRPLLISVPDGSTWEYHGLVDWPKPEYRKGLWILNGYKYRHLVDTNGHLFIVAPRLLGWDMRHYRDNQPEGYPLKPERTQQRN